MAESAAVRELLGMCAKLKAASDEALEWLGDVGGKAEMLVDDAVVVPPSEHAQLVREFHKQLLKEVEKVAKNQQETMSIQEGVKQADDDISRQLEAFQAARAEVQVQRAAAQEARRAEQENVHEPGATDDDDDDGDDDDDDDDEESNKKHKNKNKKKSMKADEKAVEDEIPDPEFPSIDVESLIGKAQEKYRAANERELRRHTEERMRQYKASVEDTSGRAFACADVDDDDGDSDDNNNNDDDDDDDDDDDNDDELQVMGVEKSTTCPLTQETFQHPVVNSCGHTYEKRAILEQLSRRRQLDCPVAGCHGKVTKTSLKKDRAMAARIRRLQRTQASQPSGDVGGGQALDFSSQQITLDSSGRAKRQRRQ
eukprot:TRINITY_DN65487_c3_g2_i1.p1 TRINITY_DN65487_c3_g2~~TRINITY_DN65487_c3_g2_i1.p1  ORF type:complete len:369 (+),score=190.95 TRINITY_DN65487_c3_g2_i1:49-1155(+)